MVKPGIIWIHFKFLVYFAAKHISKKESYQWKICPRSSYLQGWSHLPEISTTHISICRLKPYHKDTIYFIIKGLQLGKMLLV